ncbi:MAG: septum formation initiator family protein [Candidatus Doudnabacteria bacterium]|nr:septum formation initiator family protein [Candidatus Doudnabacteria bacterium]
MTFQDFLQSKIGTAVLVCGVVFVIVITGKLMSQKRDVENEIKKLQDQSEQIAKENQDLSQLINYLNTDTYKERQAREQLNLKKDGEFVVVLPNFEDEASQGSGEQELSNPKKWFNYFWENNL